MYETPWAWGDRCRVKGSAVMGCPLCKSDKFYVKDPDDAYETHEFEWRDGRVFFEAYENSDQAPEITEKIEIFCRRCAWHGPLGNLE